jgi:hypothetical protein
MKEWKVPQKTKDSAVRRTECEQRKGKVSYQRPKHEDVCIKMAPKYLSHKLNILSKKSVATLCNKTVGRNQYFEIKKSDGP